jgi:hypothetical protein
MAEVSDFEVVPMGKVPAPPVKFNASKYESLWKAISSLPPGEGEAVKYKCPDYVSQFSYVRLKMKKRAEAAGRRLLSSRNADSTVGYFWLEDEKKGK